MGNETLHYSNTTKNVPTNIALALWQLHTVETKELGAKSLNTKTSGN